MPEAEKSAAPFEFGGSEDGLNPMLLGSVGILLTSLILIVGWLVKAQYDEAAAKRRTAALLAMAEDDDRDNRRQAANVAGGRRRQVNRRVNHDADDFVNQMMHGEELEDDDEPGFSGMPIDGEEGMGKKKLAKLQQKQEKKAMREAELIEREERKKREADKEKKRDAEREQERLEELAEEERLRKEKEEREQRELEEYLKLKESFAVEEEGQDALEGEEAENLLQEFVAYVKHSKVVNMDELAAHFALKTEEAVSRLTYFLEQGDITGVMDDRGKFIYITPEELEAVAKFVNQRGRVSIIELAEYSNKLIRLEADDSIENIISSEA